MEIVLNPLQSFFGVIIEKLRGLRLSAEVIKFDEAKTKSKEMSLRVERAMDNFGNSILRLAYTYVHNTADAEEVLQDTLICYLKSAPVFENNEHEKAWLLRVAANTAKNRLRYNSVRKADELNEELVAEQREDLSFVWEAVKLLPEKYRTVIHLFYHERCSTAEIANILGKNENTVRGNLSRGREQLKSVLKEDYDFGN